MNFGRSSDPILALCNPAPQDLRSSPQGSKTSSQFSRPLACTPRTAEKHEDSPQATALSKYIWKLKNQGRSYKLNWRIHSRAPPFTSGARVCLLCLREKTAIAMCKPKHLLNQRTELLSKCIHVHNFELRNLKPPKKPKPPEKPKTKAKVKAPHASV